MSNNPETSTSLETTSKAPPSENEKTNKINSLEKQIRVLEKQAARLRYLEAKESTDSESSPEASPGWARDRESPPALSGEWIRVRADGKRPTTYEKVGPEREERQDRTSERSDEWIRVNVSEDSSTSPEWFWHNPSRESPNETTTTDGARREGSPDSTTGATESTSSTAKQQEASRNDGVVRPTTQKKTTYTPRTTANASEYFQKINSQNQASEDRVVRPPVQNRPQPTTGPDGVVRPPVQNRPQPTTGPDGVVRPPVQNRPQPTTGPDGVVRLPAYEGPRYAPRTTANPTPRNSESN